MFTFKSLLNIPRFETIAVALALVAAMGYTIISLEWLSHMSTVMAVVVLLLYDLMRSLKHRDMQNGMIGAVGQNMDAIYLFFFIGLVVSVLIMSDAVPTLMHYGFGLISPTYFYFSTFALYSVIGISIGSNLTICAAIGVTFMGMATVFHADMTMTAGAVMSGAFSGDKMSPLSDTTGISASIVGIDPFKHIKNMMYTTASAWLIGAALMLWPLPNMAAHDMNNVEAFRAQLETVGLVHAYSLTPSALLVILALMRVSAIVAMLFTVVVTLIVTYFHSTPDLKQLDAWFYSGYKLEGEAFKDIAHLISRSGLEGMFFMQTIMILGMGLSGLLLSIGVIPFLLGAIHTFLTNAGRAALGVAMTLVGVNFLIDGQYLSILPSGGTFKLVYDKLDLHSHSLARTLEDVGTVINPLVPWGVYDVFISHALNVPVWGYLPYAFFCYLSLALTLAFGWAGLTLSKK